MQPKADAKNFKLVELVAQLRDHIDIHRIIGLNVPALRNSDIGGTLLGYMQKSAQEALAMYICKIFESSSRNELNSIPGVIEPDEPIITLEVGPARCRGEGGGPAMGR